MRHIRRFWLGVFLLLTLGLLAITILVYEGLSDELAPADIAIVFGNTVTSEGQPSARLRARLDRAIDLYQHGLIPAILVSGGIGREGINETSVMQQYLRQQGIADEHIFVDHQGLNTRLTALHTAELMQTYHWRRTIVVTQYFHIARAKLALRQVDIIWVGGAHADYLELRDVYSILREVIAYPVYVLRYGWK